MDTIIVATAFTIVVVSFTSLVIAIRKKHKDDWKYVEENFKRKFNKKQSV